MVHNSREVSAEVSFATGLDWVLDARGRQSSPGRRRDAYPRRAPADPQIRIETRFLLDPGGFRDLADALGRLWPELVAGTFDEFAPAAGGRSVTTAGARAVLCRGSHNACKRRQMSIERRSPFGGKRQPGARGLAHVRVVDRKASSKPPSFTLVPSCAGRPTPQGRR
ncbi:hypothetical protein GCM10020220_104190 [Nonomuraea rubra]